jgi:CheY-like chemotaxis protein
LEILLVEDSPSDVRLIHEALRETGVNISVRVAQDGLEGMEYLRQAECGARRCPDLVLLDWNLPRKNGREVLAELKSSAGLKQIPVLVMTSSAEEKDVHDAYALNANSFITKPADLNQYVNTIRAIEAFWFFTATLPSNWRQPRPAQSTKSVHA